MSESSDDQGLGADQIVISHCASTVLERRVLPYEVRTIGKGANVYHQGDTAAYWYEVVSGIVRTCRFTADGHRQLTGFFYTDDVFGVDVPAYPEAAEAVTDVVLRRFSSDALRQDDKTTAAARDEVLKKALESARQSIFLFGHRTAANRLAAFLIGIGMRPDGFPVLQLPMTRSDIADHLNLTLHTVSRTFSEFVRCGLIAPEGAQKVRILDLDGLRVAAGDAESRQRVWTGSEWKGGGLCESP